MAALHSACCVTVTCHLYGEVCIPCWKRKKMTDSDLGEREDEASED